MTAKIIHPPGFSREASADREDFILDSDDAMQAVRGHPEFDELEQDAPPDLRATLCEFFRMYECLPEEERAEVLRYAESLLSAH